MQGCDFGLDNRNEVFGLDVLKKSNIMKQIFDFSGIENNEKSIKSTWQEFRNALANGEFLFDDIESAKKHTFLRVYDDLFNKNAGIVHNTITIRDISDYCLGRGTILSESEIPDYERFIPKKEFIKSDNRFSSPGVEWLYLAIGDEEDIHTCAKAECRAKQGQRFGFCHFGINDSFDSLKLVDLTIADDIAYETLNKQLEDYGQSQVKKEIKKAKVLGFVPRNGIDKEEFKRIFTKCVVEP